MIELVRKPQGTVLLAIQTVEPSLFASPPTTQSAIPATTQPATQPGWNGYQKLDGFRINRARDDGAGSPIGIGTNLKASVPHLSSSPTTKLSSSTQSSQAVVTAHSVGQVQNDEFSGTALVSSLAIIAAITALVVVRDAAKKRART